MFHMNDLKGQDQSTQGWAVQFFSRLMQWFSFPQSWVDAFVQDKMSKTLKHKILAIMTNSGEIWTYLLNSTSSTARECFMYNLPAGTPMANGGDDTKRRAGFPINPSYVMIKHLDPCEDKRFESTTGEFCSFITKKGVLTKDPIILLKRFLVKLASGDGENAALGYAHLWAMNYRLKDKLFEIFDEDEMAAHQILTRIMFNLKKEHVKTRINWDFLKVDGDLPNENVLINLTNDTLMDKILSVEVPTFTDVLDKYHAVNSRNEVAALMALY